MATMLGPDLLRSNRTVFALAALVIALAAVGSATAEEFTFDAKELTVINMIGKVDVVAASGDQFEVMVEVQGEDARKGTLDYLVKEGRKASLVVKFPIEQEQNFVYPELGRDSKTTITYEDRGDHGGSWLKKVFAGITGKRVTVRGRGKGLEVWADITIRVPAGRELVMENRVGKIEAEGVRGDLVLDTGSGAVTARDIEGDLVADTGSGAVEIEKVKGAVLADTGSGSVSIRGAAGDEVKADTGSGSVKVENIEADTVLVDTGSGSVRAEALTCRKLTIDTGSGSVKAREIGADAVLIDTGSGSVLLDLVRMGGGRFTIDTGSGSIELLLPGNASASITAETSSGVVRNNYPDAEVQRMERDEMKLVIRGGEARVVLDAGSGSVTVAGR